MDFELMIISFPKLLNATLITLKLLSASLVFGLFIGLLFAILRMNKNPIVNKFAYGYSYVFRGTPLLVQIFIIYFGLGQIEYLRSTVLWVILKEPYWCAIIAFALKTSWLTITFFSYNNSETALKDIPFSIVIIVEFMVLLLRDKSIVTMIIKNVNAKEFIVFISFI